MNQMDTNDPCDEERDDPSMRSVEESNRMDKQAHACPVPKPRGVVGQMLGMRNMKEETRPLRPEVIIEREEESSRKRKPD